MKINVELKRPKKPNVKKFSPENFTSDDGIKQIASNVEKTSSIVKKFKGIEISNKRKKGLLDEVSGR